MTKFVNRNKLFGFSVRIRASALNADSISIWEDISTRSADMNELADILRMKNNLSKEVYK